MTKGASEGAGGGRAADRMRWSSLAMLIAVFVRYLAR